MIYTTNAAKDGVVEAKSMLRLPYKDYVKGKLRMRPRCLTYFFYGEDKFKRYKINSSHFRICVEKWENK